MLERKSPRPAYEILNFVIDHWIIFSVGILIMCLATFYVFKNTYYVSISTFIQARLFVIIAWILFFITLWSDPNESLTSVGAIWGALFIAIACVYVWSAEKIR